MIKRFLTPLMIIMLVLVGLTGCAALGRGQKVTAQQLIQVASGDITLKVSGNGHLQVVDDASLAFASSGKVKKVYVIKGDKVTKGMLLAEIDTASLQVSLVQAQAAVAQAAYSLKKVQDSPSDEEVTAARSAVTAGQDALRSVQDNARTIQDNLKAAQDGLKAAQTRLDQAFKSPSEEEVTAARSAVTAAQDALRSVQDNARTIENNLKAAQDSLKAAQTRLDQLLWYFQLDTVLTAARADVSRAQAEVTRWQAELAGQPAQISRAQASIDSTKAQLEKLLDQSDTVLTAARADVSRAQAEVTRWQVELAGQPAQISRAQASIDSAKAQLEKLLEPPDQLAVDAARAQLTSAQQSVVEIKRQIGEAFLYSSIDGIVAAEPGVTEGDMAVSGRTVLQIIDPSRFKLEVDIDETDIPQVVVGQTAIVELDALPDVKVPGKVSYISPLPTESGGIILYRVTVDLPPGEVLSVPPVVSSGLVLPDKVNLRSGMSASADIIITERKNVVKLPSRVITKDSQGTSVVTVETNDQVQTRRVTVGVSDGLDTEILQGLAVGENVVIPKQVSESSTSFFGGG